MFILTLTYLDLNLNKFKIYNSNLIRKVNGIFERGLSLYTHYSYRFWYRRFWVRLNTLFKLFHSYGIAPRLVEPGQKPRIEVFNPCDDSDDQKTSTSILFDNEGNCLGFG